LNTVAAIHRTPHPHQAAARARLPGAPAGAAGSFAAILAAKWDGSRPAVPIGKGGPAETGLAVCPPSAASAGAYGRFIGHTAGSGQCVALVRASNPALGPTASWVRGERVQGNTSLRPGTAIATFAPSGHYANATNGSSHAAIYLGQTAQGVQVLDQWAGSPAALRTIPWNNPGAAAANTGSAFHVVRSAATRSA
jgi:hypothetical protein